MDAIPVRKVQRLFAPKHQGWSDLPLSLQSKLRHSHMVTRESGTSPPGLRPSNSLLDDVIELYRRSKQLWMKVPGSGRDLKQRNSYLKSLGAIIHLFPLRMSEFGARGINIGRNSSKQICWGPSVCIKSEETD